MITCTEATRRLWDYLDEHLPAADVRTLEEHLHRCRTCCGELEFTKELRRFLARSADMEVPPDVLSRLQRTVEEMGS
ncbi:anti-sigma factor family protein [Intrasporangium sp.]|uniref:anti-sigma factor family protein n=1 Tax=Intrasporangium sp. TaxID=1925024 RepID=UPI00293A3D95|nr:zf-HC2 domain-containing protein [Intrasporangium sp.]MDV3221757.1 zf-HC2 domain-containing protein [Intrasporangium sp.]